MNATGKRRLLKLADFLETAELPGKFYMGDWVGEIEHGRPACGTHACAMGWATTIPSFRRAGLVLNGCREPQFALETGSHAAALFFDMAYDTARDIFVYHPGNASGMTARRIVAKRLRQLVAQQDAAAKANKRRGSAPLNPLPHLRYEHGYRNHCCS